jgi:hypothetical protein
MSTPARARILAIALLALPAMAACAGSSGRPPATVGASSPASTTAPTTSVASPASETVAPATKAPSAAAVVDVDLTGWKTVAMHGSAGHCMLGMNGGKAVAFGFQALEADYPGLGNGIYISEDSQGYATIKWLPDSATGFINIKDVSSVSPDHHSITLDVDLGGGPATEHMKGTIACP